MAEEVPDFDLPPSRYMIQEDDKGSCVGTIVRYPLAGYGSFVQQFTLKRMVTNLEQPEEPPYNLPIEVNYTKVIFLREAAQKIKIGDEDYLLIHCDNILGLIPSEE